MTSSASLLDALCSHFLKGAAAQKGSKPGFAHALKLSYNTIDKSRLSGGPRSLTYRYPLSADVPAFSLGLLTALMDELSTDACFLVGMPSPPGVSLQMQTEMVVPSAILSQVKELDVVNTVSKLGRTVSFTRTDYLCADSQKLVAFSSHVKYMPTGNRFMDLIFTNETCYNLYELFVLRNTTVPYFPEKPLREVIKEHLEHTGPGNATFQVTGEHNNPFGKMHGGCHAMVMQSVGMEYAKLTLKADVVTLQALQIDFLGAASGTVQVTCETIAADSAHLQVRVQLHCKGRVSSEGKLRFVTENTINNSKL